MGAVRAPFVAPRMSCRQAASVLAYAVSLLAVAESSDLSHGGTTAKHEAIRKMLRRLQNRPRLLEVAYATSYVLLRPFRRVLKPGTKMEGLFVFGEKITKRPLFDCQMCGDCVLHSTGMTCPMTCPKNLRNGPCGGVRPNGHCEVVPDMPCVWVKAWERSSKMPSYGSGILSIIPPPDQRLVGSSAWVNEFSRISGTPPDGWE